MEFETDFVRRLSLGLQLVSTSHRNRLKRERANLVNGVYGSADLLDVQPELREQTVGLGSANEGDRSFTDQSEERPVRTELFAQIGAECFKVTTLIASRRHRAGSRQDVRADELLRQVSANVLELVMGIANGQLGKSKADLSLDL